MFTVILLLLSNTGKAENNESFGLKNPSIKISLSDVYGIQDQQNGKVVKGLITDTEGVPLPGVTIIIKGTTVGTVSDVDGRYLLPGVPENAILEYSFVGMKSQEITFSGQPTIDIVLQEETIGLEEVVAVGYGTTTRQNFTGSVTKLDLSNSPVGNSSSTNAFDLLRGVTSGVSLSQSGEAGSTPSIVVRGQKSISGGSDPLIVVDGVIFSGTIDMIDTKSIESMSILKDATSLAAYGSQAANGVIMVTTKKGVRGKPMVNLSSYVAVSEPNFKPDMRNGDEFVDLLNARFLYEPGSDPRIWMSALEVNNYNVGRTTDWFDYITQTGFQHSTTLSVSGGTEKMDYYLGSSYTDNDNFIKGDSFKRNTFTGRINTRINEYISLSGNFNQAFMQNDGIRPTYNAAVTLSPWAEPELQDRSIRKYVDGKEESTLNPLWDVYNGIDHENRSSSTVLGGNLDLKIPWIEGLTYKVAGSYTKYNTTAKHFVHETNFVNISLGEEGYTQSEQDKYLDQASGYMNHTNRTSWVLDNILTYARRIDQHYINATLVYTRDSKEVEINEMEGTDFSAIGNTTLGVYGLANAGVHTISDISYSLHKDIGYLGRLNYSFKNTYHINASVRHDGSSVFGADKKWGTFPAIGVAWTTSNEGFMKNISVLNNLKLKASWGKNGNQSLSPYGTLSTMTLGRTGGVGYYFDNEVVYGQLVSALGNTELGWETTTSYNFGLETDMWNNRIHFELDGYKSITTNQIFNRTIPVMGAGITSQSATMGQVDNWGVEAVLNTTNIKTNNFSWSSGLVFSMNRNKLVELYGDGNDDITNNLFLGESLGAIYGYNWIGIVQDDDTEYMAANGVKPGDAMYEDLNGNIEIDAEDRKILGYSKENFRMSFSNTFTYGNLQLYVLFNGVFSGNGFGMAANNMAYLSYEGYGYRNTLDHPFWTEENKSETYPSVNFSDNRFIALQSYGFVRLQDVNLSYKFKTEKLANIGINSMDIYLAGKNLWFLSPNWTGSDPEVRSYSSAQLPRTFTLGVNLSF